MAQVKVQNVRFDYVNQAWICNDVYVDCGHPKELNCGCYGRKHQGEVATFVVPEVVNHRKALDIQ